MAFGGGMYVVTTVLILLHARLTRERETHKYTNTKFFLLLFSSNITVAEAVERERFACIVSCSLLADDVSVE